MKTISQKEINYTIKQYNYIAGCLQLEENKRYITLNVINDYIKILKDERITKNQKNNSTCYNLIYTICTELEEYENNNNFIDYYEEETATTVRVNYYKSLKQIDPITKKKAPFDVVFYLDNTELLRYDLINEFYGERENTKELLAYENNTKTENIIIKIEERKEEK